MMAASLNSPGIQLPAIGAGIGRWLRRAIALVRPVKPQVVAIERSDAAPAATPRVEAVEPSRLSADRQWAKVTGVLSAAIAGANAAAQLQRTATQKIDLAQYGLGTLIDELSAVMTVPGRRERAQVVHLAAHAAEPQQQALAA